LDNRSSFPSVVGSSDPICAEPEISQQRAESAKEEKQTQGYEKDAERENEK
jgi:hypothetical protein